MTRIVIIEDEVHASQALISTLQRVAPEAQVAAVLASVEQGVQYLNRHADADLIFSDVQLPDGLSFHIFQQVPVSAPVVFVTGYDHFMLNAFACNSIDYLLKPVGAEDLRQALNKYERLQQHFAARQSGLMAFAGQFAQRKRTRLLVRKGLEYVALSCGDIMLFHTESKLVYVVDKDGRKYLCDKSLSELEAELDGSLFFRLNRQYIVNIGYIRSFRTYDRVKLQVELSQPTPSHELIVSQETAPAFRKWIAGG